MKIKTSELQGAALGAAIAMAEGREFVPYPPNGYAADEACKRGLIARWKDGRNEHFACMRCQREELDVTWERCGPILDREHICLLWDRLFECWNARDLRNAAVSFTGPTALIAAMRCFVASKLGDEVDVPEELV